MIALDNQTSNIIVNNYILFFKKSILTLLLTSIFGVLAALTYLTVTPNIYQATAQIRVIQVAVPLDRGSSSGGSFLGVNIEDSASLISRLSLPTNFSEDNFEACGLQNRVNSGVALLGDIKFLPEKNVPSMIRIVVSAPSSDLALTCARSIFELIKQSQAQILEDYLAETRRKLSQDRQRMSSLMEAAGKGAPGESGTSLSSTISRDEIGLLLRDIRVLEGTIVANQHRDAKLVAPIYSSSVPVYPVRRTIILFGAIGGLILGVLVSSIFFKPR